MNRRSESQPQRASSVLGRASLAKASLVTMLHGRVDAQSGDVLPTPPRAARICDNSLWQSSDLLFVNSVSFMLAAVTQN